MINIEISKTIKLTNYPKYVADMVKKKLTIPNPIFFKVARITGSSWAAEKEYKYYKEKNGVLVIPRGMRTRLLKWLDKVGELYEVTEDVIKTPVDSKMRFKGVLRDYQVSIVATGEIGTEGIIKASTGAGKTLVSLYIASRLGLKTTIVVPNTVLLNQFSEDCIKFFGFKPALCGENSKEIGDLTIATIQILQADESLCQRVIDNTSFLVVDECFVGHSRVLTPDGYKQIKNLNIGDYVVNPLGNCRIKNIFKKNTSSILKIKFSNETSFQVTPNHPILTNKGFKTAGRLCSKDKILTYNFVNDIMNKDIHSLNKLYGTEISKKNMRILRKRIRRVIEKEILQPKLLAKTNNENMGKTNSDRGGRGVSLSVKKTGGRQKKRESSCYLRVESIEVQKSRNTKRHKKGFTVYNLEVENHPSYVVGNIIVHNCQGFVSKERIKTISQFKPYKILGLSATPERSSDDGRTEAVPFVFGDIVVDYESEQMKPTVEVIYTGVDIAVDEYHRMIDELSLSKSRNTLISGIVMGEVMQGRKVLVLVKRIAHWQEIQKKLGDFPGFYYIDSEDKNRNETLMKMKSGELEFKAVFGTTSLLSVGTDLPALDLLIIASDMKSNVLTIQSAGRIMRLFEGKPNPRIIDLFDNKNPILKRQGYERFKVYEAKGWEIKGLYKKKP